MSEHKATIKWARKSAPDDFAKGKYSREHTWTFDGERGTLPRLCFVAQNASQDLFRRHARLQLLDPVLHEYHL